MPAVEYTKHLVECNCVLPQFKHSDPPVWHHFVVFSEIDEVGNIIPSFAQCNNCGMIHKVTEVGISSTMKRDTLPSLPTAEEIKSSLPERLQKELSGYELDLTTYQELAFIFQHQLWGRTVILQKEQVEEFLVGKMVQIIGNSLWRFQTFQEEMGNEPE